VPQLQEAHSSALRTAGSGALTHSASGAALRRTAARSARSSTASFCGSQGSWKSQEPSQHGAEIFQTVQSSASAVGAGSGSYNRAAGGQASVELQLSTAPQASATQQWLLQAPDQASQGSLPPISYGKFVHPTQLNGTALGAEDKPGDAARGVPSISTPGSTSRSPAVVAELPEGGAANITASLVMQPTSSTSPFAAAAAAATRKPRC
jgi:hypothetical protein